MSRLKGMRTYLAGPMDDVPDGGIVWRNSITPLLNKKGVIVQNPCNKSYLGLPESEEARDILKRHKYQCQYDKVAEYMQEVVSIDLHMVNTSDFIIAFIDTKVHMCGSYHEIAVANQQSKPIVCWVKQGKNATPNWILGIIPHQMIFGSLDEVVDYLCYVDEAPYINTYRRWVIPNYEMLYDPAVLSLENSGGVYYG